MLNAFLYDGVRSAFGKKGGALATMRPDDLLGTLLHALVERNDLDPAHIDDVIVGCANQAGEDSRCVARHAALAAGLPVSIPGTVVQRNCGSGLGAVISAAHAITAGEAQLVLSGGVESMSRAPFVIGKAPQAFSSQFTAFDSAVGARFPNPKVEQMYGNDSMPATADNLAREYNISREQTDLFALRSQENYAAALAEGAFAREILPVEVLSGRKQASVMVDSDEAPRATTLDALAGLRTLNSNGVTTAGNASGMNDGAVGLMVGGEKFGASAGLSPLARLVASGVAGVEPRLMGIGPVPASQLALKRAGLTLDDMDAIEINEAFSAQVLACLAGLGLAFDDPRVNSRGGAIAVGHPLGASGPRLLLRAVHELKRRGGRYALVSMCIGMGQGIAIVVERL